MPKVIPKSKSKPRPRTVKPPELAPLAIDPSTMVKLSSKLYNEIIDFADSRGANPAQVISVAVRALMRQSKHYELDTPLAFGKYSGQLMEAICRLDPNYIRWAIKSIEGLTVSTQVEVLLAEMPR